MKVFKATAKAPNLMDYLKGGYDYAGHEAAEEKYRQEVIAEAKSYGKHALAGESIRVPYADGCAEYIVAKIQNKVSLIHLAVGDAWRDDRFERLVTVAELTRVVAQNKKFKAARAALVGKA